MQSDVPPLPISCLSTTDVRAHRDDNLKPDLTAPQSTIINSLYKRGHGVLLASNRKKLHPTIAEASPYKHNAGFIPTDNAKSPSSKSAIHQRVSSAKMLRIKQLQNQLADAHFHLNELSNENKLLKAIQKRQDTALKRYEGTNAELPRIIHSHHEDLRVLQTKFKKLKCQYQETSNLLKDKENELHSLQVQNKKLLQLSKDRQLRERDKLQTQVLDLNHRINQQDEIIQTLKRKLVLESKYLKHQLHKEIIKHKETQRQLQDTQFKLKTLEELTEQKEIKSYQSSRIAFFNKTRSTTTSQSLTNLNENRSENLIKAHSFRRRPIDETTTGQSLPALNGATLLSGNHYQNSHKSAPFSINPKSDVRDSPVKECRLEEIDFKDNQMDSYLGLGDVKKMSEFPKALKQDYHYPSHDKRDEDDVLNRFEANRSLNLTNRSRMLYTRLVGDASDEMRTNAMENANGSLSFSKDSVSHINEKEVVKYEHNSGIAVVSKDSLNTNADGTVADSNSDLESQTELPVNLNVGKGKLAEALDIDRRDLEPKKTKTPPHLSKLLNEVDQYYSNSLDYARDNEPSKLNLAINNDGEISSSIDYHSMDDAAQKQLSKSSVDNSEAALNSPIYKGNCTEVNEKNIANQANNSTNSEQQLLEITQDNTQGTKKYVKHLDSNGKANHNNLEKLKEKTERKTVENTKIFDKAKLLAAMKAIDDNENVEFINPKVRRNSTINQFIPTQQSRIKSDIMKDIFSDTKLDNNERSKEEY